MRYLDPKADLTFKKVFGEHPDLVISLLNALLPLEPEEEVMEIEYLPAEGSTLLRCKWYGRRSFSNECCSMHRKRMSGK